MARRREGVTMAETIEKSLLDLDFASLGATQGTIRPGPHRQDSVPAVPCFVHAGARRTDLLLRGRGDPPGVRETAGGAVTREETSMATTTVSENLSEGRMPRGFRVRGFRLAIASALVLGLCLALA